VQLAVLASIHRYPVKALRAQALAQADVLTDGIAGDRTAALVVRSEGHARTGKTYRGKEHARLHTLAAPDDALRAAADAGVDATCEDGQGRYFDVHPVSLIFDTWLAGLAAHTGAPVEALRFRPNLVAAAVPGFGLRERDLVGARLRIGSVELEVVEPIQRCITPSYDLTTGERDRTLARALAVDLENVMGVYCTVVQPGTLAAGDAIEQLV
jgi:uncharacterized protein YcbX